MNGKRTRRTVGAGRIGTVVSIAASTPRPTHGTIVCCYHKLLLNNNRSKQKMMPMSMAAETAVGEVAEPQDNAMGEFCRLKSLSDLPPDAEIIAMVHRTITLIESGAKVPRAAPKIRLALDLVPDDPDDLASAPANRPVGCVDIRREKAPLEIFGLLNPHHSVDILYTRHAIKKARWCNISKLTIWHDYC